MKRLQLTIPKPCHENWNAMTPAEKGRHCSVCDKVVVDFTGSSRQEIEATLLNNGAEKVCGRFRTSDIAEQKEYKPEKRYWKKTGWFFLSALAVFSWPKKIFSNSIVTANPDPSGNKIRPVSNKTIIHGWIKNIDTKKGITNVQIRIYSEGKEIAFSQSFANGSYFISIPENEIWDFKIDIEYNAVDYQTQVIKNIPVLKERIACETQMIPLEASVEYTTMGLIVGDYKTVEVEVINPIKETYAVMGAVAYRHVETKYEYNEWTEDSTRTVEEEQPLAEEFSINVYPNPVRDVLNVNIEHSEQSLIYLFDLNGKLIVSANTNQSVFTYDMSTLSRGTYILKVIQLENHKSKEFKVIKVD